MPARAQPTATAPAPTGAATHTFPQERRSVGRARDALRHQLAIWHVDADVTDSAVLLLSELATNAVRATTAGCRTIGVRFELTGAELRLEVSDGSGKQPTLKHAGDEEECGRGLALVAALADRWGVEPLDAVGKVVWALLVLSSEKGALTSATDQSLNPQTGGAE